MIDLIFSGRNLFILYLVLAGQFLSPLFPCNTSRLFMDSMWLRHILGFLTLVFFIVATDTELDDYIPLGTVLTSSVLIYLWFLVSSKMTANWWLGLVVLLAILYMIDLYQERQIKEDPRMRQSLALAKNVILGLSLVLTLIGFLIYVGEKKLDYKGKFDYMTLILGTSTCKGTPNVRPYMDSLNAAIFMTPQKMMAGGGLSMPLPPISQAFLNENGLN